MVAPSFVPKLANGKPASIFADFRTEGTTNQYWTGSSTPAGFAAWLAALGGSKARASNANYFQSGTMLTAGSGVFRFPTTSGGVATGLRITPAQTELLLWNRDLTNAVWTATTVTVAKNQTGIDGAANAASSLTASAANGTVLQSLTRSSAGRISGCWVKRITGTGTINMTQNGGTTWTAITVTGVYTFVSIPQATLANPVIGFQIVTNGDAIAVDFVSHREMGTSANGIPDPIATTSATVTQAGEQATFPYSLTTGSVLTYSQNCIYPGQIASLFGAGTAAGTAAIYNGVFDATHFTSFNAGTALNQLGTATIASLNKVMSAGGTGSRKLVVNNGSVQSAATNYTGGTITTGVIGGFASAVTNNLAGDLALLAIWSGVIASNTDLGTLTT